MGVQAGQTPIMEPPRPRLCHLKKWENFQGYGFNLHTHRSKESQLVGNVDPESPADAAGVKKGDKIIEVNGTNISNENHTQVVARIKAGGDETRILVADQDCVKWHQERGQNISSSLSYVLHLSSERPASPVPSSSSSSSLSEEESAPVESPPAPVQPIVEEEEEEEEETRPTSPAPASAPAPSSSTASAPALASAPAPAPAPAPASVPVEHPSSSESESETDEEVATPSPAASPALRAPPAGKEASSSDSEPEEQNPRRQRESTSSDEEEEEVKPRSFGTQASKTSTTSTGSRFSYKKDELVAGLQLNMTAAEMRARVSRNKKPDPRTDKIDLKQKAAIIRNM